MLTRRAGGKSPVGFTLLKLLVVLAIAAVAGYIIIRVIIANTDTQHKAVKARAVQLCAASSADTGSAVIPPQDIPGRIDRALVPELDRILGRRIHWRKRQVGDQVICEMQYCYHGVKQNRPFVACTDWEPAQ